MPSTTFAEFGGATEALEVAAAFPDQVRGKTVLVTGVNLKGIGFTTAQAFASQAADHVILAGRTPAKLQECVDALKADYPGVHYHTLVVDLGSQESVRGAAKTVLAWDDVPVIDIVVNSAGIMMLPERTLSVDGIEMHFATNHLGHFLLTNLILPKLIKAAARPGVPKGAVRVVNVSAMMRGPANVRWSDTNFDKINKDLPAEEQPNYGLHKMWGFQGTEDMAYVPVEGYHQTKVANVLFGIGVTDKLYATHGIRGFALHPGVIQTELGRDHDDAVKAVVQDFVEKGIIAVKTQGAGAATSLVAALDPKLSDEGQKSDNNYGTYLWDCQIDGSLAGDVGSSAAAARLWEKSEGLVGEKFSW